MYNCMLNSSTFSDGLLKILELKNKKCAIQSKLLHKLFHSTLKYLKYLIYKCKYITNMEN